MRGDERSPDLCGRCSGADAPRWPERSPAPAGVDAAAGTSPSESDGYSAAARSSAGGKRLGVALAFQSLNLFWVLAALSTGSAGVSLCWALKMRGRLT